MFDVMSILYQLDFALGTPLTLDFQPTSQTTFNKYRRAGLVDVQVSVTFGYIVKSEWN